jgi:hypothetical protein
MTVKLVDRLHTYCTVPVDIRLSDVLAVNYDVIGKAVRSGEIFGAECAKASHLRVCSTIVTRSGVKNCVRLSLHLLLQGEVDIVRGCSLVSGFPPSIVDTHGIRGVGMLSMIAAENSPDAFGDISIARTAAAPALCPKMVMRERSPPKACKFVNRGQGEWNGTSRTAMLSLTHRNADTTSERA